MDEFLSACKYCRRSFYPSVEALKRRRVNPNGLAATMCSIQCLNKYKILYRIGNGGQFTSENVSGEKNYNWKGDNVGYWAVHDWMYLHYGRPKFCESCGSEKEKKYEWANIDGTYKRHRDNWLRLCVACHIKYDNRDRGLKIAQKRKIREKLSNNKSGFKNVYKNREGTYTAYITIAKRKQKDIGRYKTPEEAFEAYKKKALELYGSYEYTRKAV